MIQRIQSVFLLLAIVCNGLLFTSTLFEWISPASPVIYSFNAWNSMKTDGAVTSELQLNIPLIAANILIILMTGIVVFMYKNRKQQARMCHLLLLLNLGLVCLVMYQWDIMKSLAGSTYDWKAGTGLVFLILPVLAVLMARHYINKDEALVRSADRLR